MAAWLPLRRSAPTSATRSGRCARRPESRRKTWLCGPGWHVATSPASSEGSETSASSTSPKSLTRSVSSQAPSSFAWSWRSGERHPHCLGSGPMPEDPIVAALLQAADALTTGDRPRADASMERIAFRPQPNRPTSVNPGRNDGRGVRAPQRNWRSDVTHPAHWTHTSPGSAPGATTDGRRAESRRCNPYWRACPMPCPIQPLRPVNTGQIASWHGQS